MDSLVTLVGQSYTTDSLGQRIPTPTERNVWAHVQSVSRSEWFQGGQNGLRPSLVIYTPRVNYKGENTVIIAGKAYSVYRTYFNDAKDEIELYVEERVANVKQDLC